MSDTHLSSAASSPSANNPSDRANFLKRDGHGGPSTFKVPTYDPVPIAVMGCGILLMAALAFAF